jgi:hypothetical protein
VPAPEVKFQITTSSKEDQLVTPLELAKQCMEFVHAVRYVPEWLYAPRAGLRRLLEAA